MGLFGNRDPLEELRREMNGYGDGPDQHTRPALLMRSRSLQCQYHPDNGGRGRQPGDPRHFSDSIEDVLGYGRE